MEVSVESTSSLGRRIKVSVPDEKVSDLIKERMNKLGHEVRIKGFRPGKVPAKVLQSRYGDSVRKEVVQELVRSSFGDALTEEKIEPAGMPKFDEIKDKTGEPLEYCASFDIYPEVTLKKFDELSVEKPVCTIEESHIDKMLEDLKERFADFETVERAAKVGDRLKVDFERTFVDEAEDQTPQIQKDSYLNLGSDGMLPGLKEALESKKAGEVAECELTYPDDWADKAVRGKAIKLKVTLHEVCQKNKLDEPALIKKLALGDEATAEDLRTKIKDEMSHEMEHRLHEEAKESVLETLLEAHELELPVSLIDQEIHAIKQEETRRQESNQAPQLSDDDNLQDIAEKRVKLGLLINHYVKENDIKVNGQMVRAHIEDLSRGYPDPAAIVNAYYKNEQLLASVEKMVLLDQAVDAMLKEMKVQEKTVSYDEVMGQEQKADD